MMRRRLNQLASASALAVSALASVQPAYAQNITAISADRGAPVDDEAHAAPIKAEVTAGAGDEVASVKLDLTQLFSGPRDSEGNNRAGNKQLTLTVSTPWDGESDAEPLNLDGLSSGTKIKFNLTIFGVSESTGPSARSIELEEDARAMCRAKADEDLNEKLNELGVNALAAAREDVEKAHLKAVKTCNDGDGAALVKAHTRSRLRDYVTGYFPEDSFSFGVHAAVGFKDYEYVDPATLAAGSVHKNGWSAGASYTQYLRKSPTALTLSFDYEEAWKDQDEQIFCPLPAGPGPVTCVQDHAGPPQLDRSAIVRFNLRHRFIDSKGNTRVAISPKVSYDVSDNEFSAELPIYFVPGKDDTLTGGVKIGYTSEKRDVTFGVFIGVAFGLSD